MQKYYFHNKGQGLIGIIVVLVVIGLLAGGLYYYLTRQIAETPKIPEVSVVESEPEPIIEPKPMVEPESESVIVKTPELDPASGLIVIKKGVNGESFAREIAAARAWNILSLDTSDYKQIRETIRDFYNQIQFDYLLLIGANEEIPYVVYDEKKKSWLTAPTLYGDVNSDRFIELAVGVLPFSSEAELRKYFTDLEPKGNFITGENYAHHFPDVWWKYTSKQCLASALPNFRIHKLTPPLDLAGHYRKSAVVFLSNAGSPDRVSSRGMPPYPNHYTPVLHICSFSKNFDGNLSEMLKRDPSCQEIKYLTNRPIISHNSCNNAEKLGKQLIENGAGAFIGYYAGGGFSYQEKQQFLSGKSIGEVLKNIYNADVIYFTSIKEQGIIPNIPGLNNFDFTEGKESPYSTRLNLILYGDPVLKIPQVFPKLDANINITQQIDEIVIDVASPKRFVLDVDPGLRPDTMELLCYTGEAVSNPSKIGKENVSWFKNHELRLIFPVTNINRIKSQKVTIDGQVITLDEARGEAYTINLIKGKAEQYIYMIISSTQDTKAKLNRLDYTKNIQILINYE